jgi:predicted Zn-dependent peptidase
VLYDTYPNAHNGYGDFTDLEQADLDDAAAFFDAYYAPGNAVLTVVGDLDPDEAATLVEKHFGDIPARPVPARPSFAEPPPDGVRREDVADAHAPLPALALGHRLPDPHADLDAYLAHAVLASLLTDGEAARLTQRLVYGDALVTDVSASCGLMGAPLDARDPDTFTVTAVHPASVDPDRIIAAVDDELATLTAQGPDPEELRRVTARWASSLHREQDRLMSRMLALGAAELVQGRAELADELPGRIAAITPDAVAAAAGTLRPDARAVLTVTPGGAA